MERWIWFVEGVQELRRQSKWAEVVAEGWDRWSVRKKTSGRQSSASKSLLCSLLVDS